MLTLAGHLVPSTREQKETNTCDHREDERQIKKNKGKANFSGETEEIKTSFKRDRLCPMIA